MAKKIPEGKSELSIYIDTDLKFDFKSKCARERKSMSEKIEELIRKDLNDTTSSK